MRLKNSTFQREKLSGICYISPNKTPCERLTLTFKTIFIVEKYVIDCDKTVNRWIPHVAHERQLKEGKSKQIVLFDLEVSVSQKRIFANTKISLCTPKLSTKKDHFKSRCLRQLPN